MEIDLTKYLIRKGEIEDYPPSPDPSSILGRNEGENWMVDPSSLGLGLKAMIGFVCEEVGSVEKMNATAFIEGLRSIGLDMPEVQKVRTVDRAIGDQEGGDAVEGF